MAAKTKCKTFLTLYADALDRAEELEINVSAVPKAGHKKWLTENADAFAAQADWHERNGHPLADIIAAPGGSARLPEAN